jgi:hypothetical protein
MRSNPDVVLGARRSTSDADQSGQVDPEERAS